MDEEIGNVAANLADHLNYWEQAGIKDLAPSPTGAAEAPVLAAAPGAEPAPETTLATPAPAVETRSETPAPAGGLDVLEAELAGCTRCSLAGGRTHIVYGVGDPKADVVFVGEAPGRDEDLKGEPFIGRAGQLLTTIIEQGMGVPRASVYICNTVKCRPPENRNPNPEELAACEPFLIRQLGEIRPRVIVAMGKFAAQALCRSDVPISRLRGNWHEYEGMAVMPTFHPAYLLRNPSAKRDVWDDIQLVMARVGLPVKDK